jgi:hypothetical protein
MFSEFLAACDISRMSMLLSGSTWGFYTCEAVDRVLKLVMIRGQVNAVFM